MQPSKYEFYLQISLTDGDDNSAQINPPFFGVYLKRPRMGLQMKAVAGPKRLNKPSMMHTAISTAFLINIFYRSVH